MPLFCRALYFIFATYDMSCVAAILLQPCKYYIIIQLLLNFVSGIVQYLYLRLLKIGFNIPFMVHVR